MTYHPMRLLFIGRPGLLFLGRARGARGRGRKNYAEIVSDGSEDDDMQPSLKTTKTRTGRGRRKSSEMELETGNLTENIHETNGDSLSMNGKVEAVGKKSNAADKVNISGGNQEKAANEMTILGPKRTTRAMKSPT